MEILSYVAPGTFALKLDEVIDDGHILKCATKNPTEMAVFHWIKYRVYYASVHVQEYMERNANYPRVSYLLWGVTAIISHTQIFRSRWLESICSTI